MVAMFIQRLAESLLFLLKLTKDQRLDHKEEVLSAEIARFVGSMAKSTPYLARVGKRFPDPVVQKVYVEKILNWLVPPAALRIFVQMVLYELQLDGGAATVSEKSAWSTLRWEFVRDAYKRVGMKEQALRALSQILVRCSEYRYDVLEVFSVGEVFLAQNVRPSFLGELLMNLNLGSFTLFVEKFIEDYDLLVEEQHVLQMEPVYMQKAQGFCTYLLVVTNKKCFLLEPSREKPAFMPGESFETWDPAWETIFPREPLVVWERDFSTLLRIWRGYGSQILALEWEGVGKSQYETTSPEANSKIQCEVYLFCRPDRSAAIAESLRAAAQAAGGRDAPPPVLTDPAFREAVLAQSGEEQVLDATVAVLGPAPRLGLFAAEAKAHTTPRLFVLTVSSVLEFAINSSAWAPVSKLDPAMFEDFTPADLEEAEQEQEEDVLPPPSEEDMALRHLQRMGGQQLALVKESGSLRPALTLSKKYSLPPSEIHFETRNEADLTLHFSGGAVCIRFFTDSSRELWRRGLAYVLTKSEKGWERQY